MSCLKFALVVHFDEDEPQCFVDDHVKTDEEIKAYWFQPADFALFQRQQRAHLRALSRANGDVSKLDIERWCFRGIEELLSDEYAKRMTIQREAYMNAAMDEQDRQENEDIRDEFTLRKLCAAFSEMDRLQARELGRHDAIVVKTGKDAPIPLEVPGFHISDRELLFSSIEIEISKSLDDLSPSMCVSSFNPISIHQPVSMSA